MTNNQQNQKLLNISVVIVRLRIEICKTILKNRKLKLVVNFFLTVTIFNPLDGILKEKTLYSSRFNIIGW